jgi:AdoMet-dependent heme synthase
MGDCACDVRLDQLDPNSPVSHFFLELTPDCNNDCPGCGSLNVHRPGPPPLPAAGWQEIIDKLPPTTQRLRITGGEPTLHPEFEEIVANINSLGIHFSVFTNARWSDPGAVINFLSDKRNLECILVSIHGARANSHEAFTATPGSFDETIANVRRAAQAGLHVASSTVITQPNYAEMGDIVALMTSLGVERITINRYIGPPLPEIEPDEGELSIAISAIEKLAAKIYPPQQRSVLRYGTPMPHCFTDNSSNGCMAGFVHAAIDPWGNLRPCSHTSITPGNLLKGDFDGIWESPVMKRWRKDVLYQCDGCSIVDRCRGACLAQALWQKMSFDPLISRVDN